MTRTAMTGTTALADEYQATGMLRRSLPLDDSGILPELIKDSAVFVEAIAKLQRRGIKRRVPYLLTRAIRRVAGNPAILHAVGALLGRQEPWVMWGPNIREDIPNQAGNWHVDCESVRWPTVTVVVGLAGCHDGNATRYIPGSHRLGRGPTPRSSVAVDAIVADAAALDPSCDRVVTFEGFGDGRFYVFDAAGWHCGEPAAAAGRKLLFLHYQRASEPRIPYMFDYQESKWFDYPATYFSSDGRENRKLYPITAGDRRARPTLRGLYYRLCNGWGAL